eukprot:scaffold2952_cov141-Skeletonema_dohrnii-CCMP3373.AAC.6
MVEMSWVDGSKSAAVGAEADEHEQGLQHSTKANQLRGIMKRCKEQPILDKLSRAVTDSGILILNSRPIHSRPTIVLTYSAHFLAKHHSHSNSRTDDKKLAAPLINLFLR